MFCGNCGKEISDQAGFCPYCGEKVIREESSDSQLMVAQEVFSDGSANTDALAPVQTYVGNTVIDADRSLLKFILFSILTCGIYGFYFIYKLAADVNILCEGDGKKTPGLLQFVLLSLVTCSVYSYIWEYSLGNRLAENAPRYGLQFMENGTNVLLWRVFGSLLCGLGYFVAYNIIINNTNALARAYNAGIGK